MMCSSKQQLFISLLFFCVPAIWAQKDPHFVEGRTTIVHLFEWKWPDIANECEGFLHDYGYAGVQISPPNENIIVEGRPWLERYQTVSFNLTTRSGNQAEFIDMVSRCNAAGIRIYVDTAPNHVTQASGVGTAGNTADRDNKNYPGVPYTAEDFHATCAVSNFSNASNVRNCDLQGLADLDQSLDHVREVLINYMNSLIPYGVAGFRIDLAKYMTPTDLDAIWTSLDDLSTDHGYEPNSRPFVYQEVDDTDFMAVRKFEYNTYAAVLDFLYGGSLSAIFQKGNLLTVLENWGPEWGLLDSGDAVAFIDNHDNQRAPGSIILNYKSPKPYRMAIAFMQAHPYGTTRVISSFAFTEYLQAPPHDSNDNLLSPTFNDDLSCDSLWICEHRWRQVRNMVGFRNTVLGTNITNWWTNYDQQIAFSRGERGFIAFTQEGDIRQNIPTNLPEGVYCDIISGEVADGACTGKTVTVDATGDAWVVIDEDEEDGVLAIHVNAKL